MNNNKKSGFTTLMGIILVAGLLFTTLSASTVVGIKSGKQPTEVKPIKDIPVDPYNKELKNWIEGLVIYESNNRHEMKILDVNGEYSYSCLQFQIPTFLHFAKHPDFGVFATSTPDSEVLSEIYNCNIQKEIAFRMIKDNYNSWKNWFTSVITRDYGLPPISRS